MKGLLGVLVLLVVLLLGPGCTTGEVMQVPAEELCRTIEGMWWTRDARQAGLELEWDLALDGYAAGRWVMGRS